MKKYHYLLVIQQNFGAYGWEDVSEYEATSTGICLETELKTFTKKDGSTYQRPVSLCKLDAKEYAFSGYPTRIIFRRTINQ